MRYATVAGKLVEAQGDRAMVVAVESVGQDIRWELKNKTFNTLDTSYSWCGYVDNVAQQLPILIYSRVFCRSRRRSIFIVNNKANTGLLERQKSL